MYPLTKSNWSMAVMKLIDFLDFRYIKVSFYELIWFSQWQKLCYSGKCIGLNLHTQTKTFLIQLIILLNGHSNKKRLWYPFLKQFEKCARNTGKSFCRGDSGGPSLVCKGKLKTKDIH